MISKDKCDLYFKVRKRIKVGEGSERKVRKGTRGNQENLI